MNDTTEDNGAKIVFLILILILSCVISYVAVDGIEDFYAVVESWRYGVSIENRQSERETKKYAEKIAEYSIKTIKHKKNDPWNNIGQTLNVLFESAAEEGSFFSLIDWNKIVGIALIPRDSLRDLGAFTISHSPQRKAWIEEKTGQINPKNLFPSITAKTDLFMYKEVRVYYDPHHYESPYLSYGKKDDVMFIIWANSAVVAALAFWLFMRKNNPQSPLPKIEAFSKEEVQKMYTQIVSHYEKEIKKKFEESKERKATAEKSQKVHESEIKEYSRLDELQQKDASDIKATVEEAINKLRDNSPYTVSEEKKAEKASSPGTKNSLGKEIAQTAYAMLKELGFVDAKEIAKKYYASIKSLDDTEKRKIKIALQNTLKAIKESTPVPPHLIELMCEPATEKLAHILQDQIMKNKAGEKNNE